MKYEAVIFDFHGVFTDHQLRTVRSYHRAGREAFGLKAAYPPDELQKMSNAQRQALESFRSQFNRRFYQAVLTRPSHTSKEGSGQTNKDFLRKTLEGLGVSQDQVKAGMREFDQSMDEVFIPMPGLRQLVGELSDANVEMMLLTNGSKPDLIRQTMRGWRRRDIKGLYPLPERVYSSHLSGAKKPHQRSIEYIFDDLDQQGISLDPRKTLLVGDYRDDIRAAHNVGIDSVLMIRGCGQEEFVIKDPRPTYVVSEPMEILDIVMGRRGPERRTALTIEHRLWKGFKQEMDDLSFRAKIGAARLMALGL